MTIETIWAILASIATVVFGFLAFRREQRSDDHASAREMAILLTDVSYVKSQLDSLTRRFEQHDDRFTRNSERVASVEQTAKAAHARLDAILNTRDNR